MEGMQEWQALVGLGALPAVLPLLVEHVKAAARAVRGEGSPWPLVTDVAAVAWVLALWDAGLLGGGLRGTTVVLLGLTAGAAAGLGYDGWRRLQSRSAEAA